MNIGFDAKRAFHNTTGLGNYGRNTLESLLRYFPDNHLHLYTPEFGADKNFLYKGLPKNVFIHTPNGIINRSFPSLWRSKGIVKDLKKDNILIYHGLSNELPFGMKHSKIKSVVTIHDVIFMRYPHLYPAVDRSIYAQKWSHAIEAADKIVAVSEQTKQDIAKFFKTDENKIEVIYPGVSNKFSSKPDEAKRQDCLTKYKITSPFLFFVGRIEERKNLSVVVEALALVNEDERPLFVIAGKKTDYFPQLQLLIEKKQLDKSVLFVNQVTDEELNCLYHSALAVVYPSVFEGFGFPVAEAQGAGVPVICSDEPIMHETSGEAALFADAHSPEAWQVKIHYVANNTFVLNECSSKGTENIKRFEERAVTTQLYNLYQSLI